MSLTPRGLPGKIGLLSVLETHVLTLTPMSVHMLLIYYLQHVHSGSFIALRSEFKRHLLRKLFQELPTQAAAPSPKLYSISCSYGITNIWNDLDFCYNLFFFCFCSLEHKIHKIRSLSFNIHYRNSWPTKYLAHSNCQFTRGKKK